MNYLVRNAHLVPIDGPTSTQPVDVRLSGSRVVEVGFGLAASGAEIVDAQGRWLMPGLWDQHVHLGQWALMSQRLDVSGARSVADALDLVRRKVAEAPDVPIVGWGHRSATWAEPMTVAALDEVSGLRPTVLISGDGHHAWLNSVALRGIGLAPREGVVAETEWFDSYPRLAALVGSDGTSPDAYLHAMRAAAAKGIVGIVDLEFDQGVHEWGERAAAGAELLRVRVGAYANSMDSFIGAGVRGGDTLPGSSPLVTMGPLKVISDGSLNTRTAWCHDPYLGSHHVGAANLTPVELVEMATIAKAQGWELAAHAIGDAAVTQALNAFAESGVRGSIEHAQLIKRKDSRRLATLGVRASVQPAHLLDDRDLAEACWGKRSKRCFALRWLIDEGATVVLGSDAPVSPLDPWLAVAAAIHRSADDREPWHPEQALTVHEALAASTDGRGTVKVGSLADLILLDFDPLAAFDDSAAQSKHLRDMQVSATWVDGVLIHQA